MTALWPHGYTALERRDDIASGEAAARSAPQLGTRARDLGSWPEPGERVTLLSVFKEGCWDHYHRYGGKWPAKAPRAAYLMAVSDRYKYQEVLFMQRLPAIEAVLDRAEAEVQSGC